jgi:hypothetical protein
MEAGLRARLRLLEDELSKLDEFREAKRRMEDKIVELEATNKAATETFRAEQADQVGVWGVVETFKLTRCISASHSCFASFLGGNQ